MIEYDDTPIDTSDVCPTCSSILEEMIAEGNYSGEFTCPDCGEDITVSVGSFDPRSPDFIKDVVNHLAMRMVDEDGEVSEDLRKDLEQAALHMWETALSEIPLDSEEMN